jgi:hypothetical protein
MGGIIAKTSVSDSGATSSGYGKAPDDLTLAAAVKQQLDCPLRFQRSPAVTRVILVAVLRRGSTLAESLADKIGRMLMAVPQMVLLPMRLALEQYGIEVVLILKHREMDLPLARQPGTI